MCSGCWGLCLHLITMSWNEIRSRPGGAPGGRRPTCGLAKVRPVLCSSMVKCSILITELLSLRALQSYSYQSPVVKEILNMQRSCVWNLIADTVEAGWQVSAAFRTCDMTSLGRNIFHDFQEQIYIQSHQNPDAKLLYVRFHFNFAQQYR